MLHSGTVREQSSGIKRPTTPASCLKGRLLVNTFVRAAQDFAFNIIKYKGFKRFFFIYKMCKNVRPLAGYSVSEMVKVHKLNTRVKEHLLNTTSRSTTSNIYLG